MAIISLMTASALAPLAAAGSALYGVLAAQLALLSGAGAAGLRPAAHRLPGQLLLAPGDERLHDRLGDRDRVRPGPAPAGRAACRTGTGPARSSAWARWRCCCWRAATWPPLLLRCGLPPGAADIGAKLAPMLLVLAAIALVAPLGLTALGVRTTGAGAGRPAAPEPGVVERRALAALLQPALLIGFMCFLISDVGRADAGAQAQGKAAQQP
jgi:SulP family sulfate permease